MATSTQKPYVLLLSLTEFSGSEQINGHLYSALRARGQLSEVIISPNVAVQRLSSSPGPKAVLVINAPVTERKHEKVLDKLTKYAQAGGTVVFACQFSTFVRPLDMNAMFQKKWNLPWASGSYHRTEFDLNNGFTGFDMKDLSPQYSMKALHLKNVRNDAAVYLPTDQSRVQSLVFAPTPVGDLEETPAAFASVGSGFIGYIGDVNMEEETTKLAVAMLLSSRGAQVAHSGSQSVRSTTRPDGPTPHASPATSKPYVVLLALEKVYGFENINHHLLSALRSKTDVKEVTSITQAVKRLSAVPAPQAVIVTDAAVLDSPYKKVLSKLIACAKGGSTVIFACQFSALVEWPALDNLWARMGLSCRTGSYTRVEVELNPTVLGLNTDAWAQKAHLKALFLKNVPRNEALYLPIPDSHVRAPDLSGTSGETPAALLPLAAGRVGFIGDVNSSKEMTNVILAMCSASNGVSRNTHPGTRVSRGKNPAEPRTPSQRDSRPVVLTISMDELPSFAEMETQLFSGLGKNAVVHRALTADAASKYLSEPTVPNAVLVTHPPIVNHAALVQELIDYARSGGRVIFANQFGGTLEYSGFLPFFKKWGFEWAAGAYHRTTFALNPAGVPAPLRPGTLFNALSMKASHLKNVAPEHRVYVPTRESRLESHVFDPTPISGALLDETPAAWAPVGSGYLGYVGDVNAEQEVTRLIIEMCGVSLKPGDLGPRRFALTVTMEDKKNRAHHETHAERPLPPLQHVPRSRRPREEEVTARAVKRASKSRLKRIAAEKLKEEGNALFREQRWLEAAEKYRKAALNYGPRPVYMSNLAAALLKAQRFTEAESAASRALYYEPDYIKARYRRGLARKEEGRYYGAINDFRSVLRQDASSSAARDELEKTLLLLSQGPSGRRIDEDDEGAENGDAISDIVTESDSSEFEHEGNGRPCRYNNHGGCRHGAQCHFKHAPDDKSVRDELGRNVCLMWLLGRCTFTDAKCYYAHDKTYLPQHGWWNSQERITRMCEHARTVGDAAGVPTSGPSAREAGLSAREARELFGLFVELARNWRSDDWALVRYSRKVKGASGAQTRKDPGRLLVDTIQRDGEFQSAYKLELPKEDEDEDEESSDDDEESSDDDGGMDDDDGGLDDEMLERADNFGFTQDEVHELLCQGVKPWDDDARDVLHALQDM